MKKLHAQTFILCVYVITISFIFNACDSSQQNSAKNTEEVLLETTQHKVAKPPRSLSMMILEKEESGEWSNKEAILIPLQILAGEVDPNDHFDSKNIAIESRGRIIGRAKAYLQDSEDETVNKELRRLLDLVYPPIEKIEQFSVPEEDVVPANTSQIWLDWLIPTTYAIPAECITAWHDSGISGDTTTPGAFLGADCFARRDRPRTAPRYRYFYPIDWVGTAQQRYVNMTEEALNRSIEKFGGLGLPLQNIDLAFLPNELFISPPDDWAGTELIPRSTDCQIAIHENAWSELSDNEFKHTIAHEIFHCIQLWKSTRQVRASGSDWWVEGTAEYFANYVYPCENGEQQYVNKFDEFSENSWLIGMEYSNVVFFQYLANVIGNASVIQFIETMPTTNGIQTQLDALANYPNMSTLFHQFGKQYLDREIADSCEGTKINVTPDLNRHEILWGSEEIEFGLAPFHVPRNQLIFHAGDYRIEIESPIESMEQSDKQGSEAAWEEMPNVLNFEVACGERIDLLALLTRGDNEVGTRPVKLKINREGVLAGVPPVDERGIDRCLVGNWRLEAESMEDMGVWMADYLDDKFKKAKGVQSNTEFLGLQGGMDGHFTAGGRAFGSVNGLEQKLASIQQHKHDVLKDLDINMDITVTINSNSCAEFSANGSELVVWNIISEDEARSRIVSIINGKEVVLEPEEPFDMNITPEQYSSLVGRLPASKQKELENQGIKNLPDQLRFPYQCSGNRLEIDGPLKTMEGAPSLRFRKVLTSD